MPGQNHPGSMAHWNSTFLAFLDNAVDVMAGRKADHHTVMSEDAYMSNQRPSGLSTLHSSYDNQRGGIQR